MPTRRVLAQDRLTPTDRAARVLTSLMRGATLTEADIARLTGLRRASVYRFMARLSLYAPIYCDAGRWRWCDDTETND